MAGENLMEYEELLPPYVMCPICEAHWPEVETYRMHLRQNHAHLADALERIKEKADAYHSD